MTYVHVLIVLLNATAEVLSEEVQRCRGEQAEGYLRALLSSRGRHVTHTD